MTRTISFVGAGSRIQGRLHATDFLSTKLKESQHKNDALR